MKSKSSSTPLTIGQHFGYLIIDSESSRHGYWNVTCSLDGNHKEVRGDNLTSGRTSSCGCRRTKHGATAGKARTPTYESWRDMHARCRDTTDSHYGGRGITVCDAWADFPNFLRDMHERPEGQTLDRVNVLEGYNRKNCKWSTNIEQRDNRTDSKYLVYESSYYFYKNTPREWAAYLARTTGKKWDTKTLRACLKLFTLEQILGAADPCRRTPDELLEETQRRLHERARRSCGMPPAPHSNHVRDAADDAIDEWLGADEPSGPEPGIPEYLTEAEVACIEEMEHFTFY